MKTRTLEVVIYSLCFIMLSFTFNSCQTEKSVKREIERLNEQKLVILADIQYLIAEKEIKKECLANMDAKRDSLKESINIYEIYASGRAPRYVLEIKLKQSHFTLDLSKHAKDAMNAITFEIPVDKEFYDSVEKGEEIVDEFRTGSLIMNGDFGKWKMTVISKTIK